MEVLAGGGSAPKSAIAAIWRTVAKGQNPGTVTHSVLEGCVSRMPRRNH